MIQVESPFPPGAIVFPTGMTPRFHEFYDSLDGLHVPDGVARMRMGGPDCDTNRNKAIRLLPERVPNADWVLFLDDDQTFQPDSLMRLLYTLYQNPAIDAVTGWYVRKVPPFEPVLFHIVPPGGDTRFQRITYAELAAAREKAPLMRIGACGGGMLLIRRTSLDRIGDPWFCPGPGRSYGGDLGLGGSMLHTGMSLYVDLSLPVGHSVPAAITPEWVDGAWVINFTFGSRSVRMPAAAFEPELAHAK